MKMKKFKEHSINEGMNISKKVYSEITNVKFININDMDLKYEFKKEFKQHLYYNIYQNPPGVLSLINDLTLVKDLILKKGILLKDLIVITLLGDFGLYYNKDEFY